MSAFFCPCRPPGRCRRLSADERNTPPAVLCGRFRDGARSAPFRPCHRAHRGLALRNSSWIGPPPAPHPRGARPTGLVGRLGTSPCSGSADSSSSSSATFVANRLGNSNRVRGAFRALHLAGGHARTGIRGRRTPGTPHPEQRVPRGPGRVPRGRRRHARRTGTAGGPHRVAVVGRETTRRYPVLVGAAAHDRDRDGPGPAAGEPGQSADGPSGAARHGGSGFFPSGHAATACVAFGACVLLLRGAAASPRLWWWLVGACVVFNAGVGYGLVRRGYHWPLDVVASWALGVFLLWGAVTAARVLLRRRGGAEAP